jgi:hypothetical protein
MRREPSLSCGGIDDQMGRVWRAGSRHDPFNSAWVVASARSVGPAHHNYIFLLYKKSYIHIYSLYSILKTPEHDVQLVRQVHCNTQNFIKGIYRGILILCALFAS